MADGDVALRPVIAPDLVGVDQEAGRRVAEALEPQRAGLLGVGARDVDADELLVGLARAEVVAVPEQVDRAHVEAFRLRATFDTEVAGSCNRGSAPVDEPAVDEDEDVGPALSAARDALLVEIRRAFPARRPEPFPPLVDDPWSNEARRVASAFAGATDWTVLDADWLHEVPNAPNGLVSALSFLSPAALRFYLPAYLTAALKLQLDPMHSLTFGFDARTRDDLISAKQPERGTCGAYARARWAALTPQQVGAVARFLEWRVALAWKWRDVLPGMDWDRDAAEALAHYWGPRAAGTGEPA